MNLKNKVRLIGFYNKPNQNMKEENEYIEEAKKFTELFKISFDSLIKNTHIDPVFKSVLIGNTVFILKDEESNLIAYYPYKNISRISNVVYNKKDITPMPLEYKSWFIPGEKINLLQIHKEEKNRYANKYIITTSGSDFLITKGNTTLPLSWNEDTYISIKDLYDLINDSWLYLSKYETDIDCSDCDGYDYSNCDYSRCKQNCDKCGGRRYMCNNSCFNYRYKIALKVCLDYDEINNEIKPLLKELALFKSKHNLAYKDFLNDNYNKLDSIYEHCYKISKYIDIENTIMETYIEEFKFCSRLNNERNNFNLDSSITICINEKAIHRISIEDLYCNDHALFWTRYHLTTNENTYDYISDSLTSIDYKLRFVSKEKRNKFKIFFDSKKMTMIFLRKDDDNDKLLVERYHIRPQ